MSTWIDVSTYIKTQLKPGVLGNTNVQKILNAVLAIVNQINAGNIDPENDSLWKADISYPADSTPVLWLDNWLVSNIDDNEGNVPISTAGVVHPTWRIIGSSVGSGIRVWEAIVYPNVLEIVFQAGSIYYLNRDVVGSDPFVSIDFATELADGQWMPLLEGSLSEDTIAALAGNGGVPNAGNKYVTEEGLGTVLDGLDLSSEARKDEVEYIILSPTSGTLIIGKWYNDSNELKTVTDQPIVFAGLPGAGELRWDVMEGRADGTAVLVSGTAGASAVRPTIASDVVVLFELIWNELGEAAPPPSNQPSVWSTERFSTAVVANTTGKYCKIMEMNLGFAQDYSFTLDYGAPASLAANKVGSLHVAFVCTEARIIHSSTVKLTTVGFSEAGDFVLVQLPDNKAALYHKSTNYWMRLVWRVVFHSPYMALSNFKQGQVYETLPSGASWPSVVNSGGTMTPEQIRDSLATLAGDDRLDASSIKNLPDGGGSGGGLTKVPFTTSLRFDKNYKSETSQTGALAFTLDNTDLVLADNYSNRYEIEIEANGTGGVPTFSADFEIQYSDWSNNTGDINRLVCIISKTGKVAVWLDNIITA